MPCVLQEVIRGSLCGHLMHHAKFTWPALAVGAELLHRDSCSACLSDDRSGRNIACAAENVFIRGNTDGSAQSPALQSAGSNVLFKAKSATQGVLPGTTGAGPVSARKVQACSAEGGHIALHPATADAFHRQQASKAGFADVSGQVFTPASYS